MARKTETIVTLTDDMDGSTATRTIKFSVDGVAYELDVNTKNGRAFDKTLAPYVGAARKVRSSRANTRRGNSKAAGGKRGDLAEVRAWAKSNGYTVSDRGRIPATVLEAFDAK